jgi:hypothetical protein
MTEFKGDEEQEIEIDKAIEALIINVNSEDIARQDDHDHDYSELFMTSFRTVTND